jgi:hypothetical protein
MPRGTEDYWQRPNSPQKSMPWNWHDPWQQLLAVPGCLQIPPEGVPHPAPPSQQILGPFPQMSTLWLQQKVCPLRVQTPASGQQTSPSGVSPLMACVPTGQEPQRLSAAQISPEAGQPPHAMGW